MRTQARQPEAPKPLQVFVSGGWQDCPAVIYVDGEEFIRCAPGEDARALLEQVAVNEEWSELALAEWKPRHGAYLRTVLRTRGGAA